MSKVNEAEAEQLSNYEKLERNKNGALAFAGSIVSGEPIDPDAQKKALKESESKILQDAQNALSGDNYSIAIQKLDQLKDAKIGISWHESSDNDKNLNQGTKALVRDARNVTNDEKELKEDASEKYAMQALNEVRAAMDLLDADSLDSKTEQDKQGKEPTRENLKKAAFLALEQMEQGNLNYKSIKEINTYIVDQLEKAGVDDAAKKLNFAKEIANFKDEHKHIATLTSVKDSENKPVTVIEADIMLNGLTEKQKEMYKAIAKQDPKGSTIENPDLQMGWYNEMPEYKRKMLAEVAGDIAEGNKVIPAQLLRDLPGLRNAYNKVTAIKRDNHEHEIVAENIHCGAPATKIKLTDKAASKQMQEDIVAENIAQLQSFVPPKSTIHLNNLTSVTPGNVRNEDFIEQQVTKAASNSKKQPVVVSTSPINRWRLFGGGGREQKAFDDNLQELGEVIGAKGETPETSNYLKNGDSIITRFASTITFGAIKTNYQKAQNELETNGNAELKAAIDAKKRLNEITVFSNSGNINLEISAKMSVVSNYCAKNAKKALTTIINFCKSGKDRTGLVMMESSHEAVSSALGIDPNSPKGKDNNLRMVAGGHTQEMAGIQGGTTGCHSVKTNPEFGLNNSDKRIDGIINQKSAKFNSSIKVVKEQNKDQTIAMVDTNIKQLEDSLIHREWDLSSKQIDNFNMVENPSIAPEPQPPIDLNDPRNKKVLNETQEQFKKNSQNQSQSESQDQSQKPNKQSGSPSPRRNNRSLGRP